MNEIVPDLTAANLSASSHREMLIPTANAVFSFRLEATVFEHDHIALLLRDAFGTVVWRTHLIPPDGGQMLAAAEQFEQEESSGNGD